jgi:hypothetical protein
MDSNLLILKSDALLAEKSDEEELGDEHSDSFSENDAPE